MSQAANLPIPQGMSQVFLFVLVEHLQMIIAFKQI
jgi:hypothetical protein